MADYQGQAPVVPQAGQPNQVPANPQPQQQPAQPAQQPATQTVPEPQPVQPQLSPDVSQRTQDQFEKLKESNRRLYEMNQLMQQQLSQISGQNQPQAPQSVPQVNPSDFVEVDPVTGAQYVNGTRLQEAIKTLEVRAKQAEEAVNKFIKASEEREVRRQEAEAYEAYPELNPESDKFDKRLAQQARGLVLDSLYYSQDYGGRPLSFKEAADFIKAGGNPGDISAAQQQAEESKTDGQPAQGGQSDPQQQPVQGQQQPAQNPAQDAKAQAAASVTSQPQNAPSPTDTAELRALRDATRRDDMGALIARLNQVDHIVPFNGNGSSD